MRHFWAKSVLYSLRFWGWARGPGMLWTKNWPGHAPEVGDRTSVVHLIFLGHLGGQTGETTRIAHFHAT